MRLRHSKVGLLCICLLLLTQASWGDYSPWPKFRQNLKNTALSPHTGPADNTLSWSYQTNDGVTSSPTIGYDGTIYFGSGWAWQGQSDSSLYALNPDGSLKWRFETDGGFFSSPFIAEDGTIFVGGMDTYVYALEDSGSYANERWKTKMGSFFVIASPVLSPDGLVYVGNSDWNFFAMDPATGNVEWDWKANWCIISSIAIGDDNTIYVGSKDHHLYAIDPDLQGPKWSVSTGEFFDGHLVDCSPAIGADGTIYFGSDQFGAAGHWQDPHNPIPVDTAFWAANPDGTLKWNFFVGDGVESSPAIGPDGTIYFGSFDGALYALTDMGGYADLKWKFQTGGAIDASPTVDADGVIYIGSRDSTLYALYPDGTIKWTFEADDGFESSATIDDKGHVLVGCFNGKLYCIGAGLPDVGVTAVNLPGPVETNNSFNPKATVKNFRQGGETFDVICEVDTNGVVFYTDQQTVTNLNYGTRTLTFAPVDVGPDSGQVYNATVYIQYGADENSYNDSNTGSTESVFTLVYLCGDANGDGGANIGDAVFLTNFVFKGGASPWPVEAGDANCDGSTNVGDSVYLINYVFKGGDPPCASCPE